MAPATTIRAATLVLQAPVGAVWALVGDPAQHHRFDASGMVGTAVTERPPVQVGDVFTMEMTYTDGQRATHYRTDNHVTAIRPRECLEWTVAPHGEQPLGWHWRYELQPLSGDNTSVTLTYDWTGTPAANVARFGVPLVDEDDLVESLARLAAAVGGGPAR